MVIMYDFIIMFICKAYEAHNVISCIQINYYSILHTFGLKPSYNIIICVHFVMGML